jgi:hypothetical protein
MEKQSVIEQDLIFPEVPDFMAEQVVFSATEMAEMCERLLPVWNLKRYASPDPEFLGEPFSLFYGE